MCSYSAVMLFMVKYLWHTCSCSLCQTLSKHFVCRNPSSWPPFPFCDERDHLHTHRETIKGAKYVRNIVIFTKLPAPKLCVKTTTADCDLFLTWTAEMNMLILVISTSSQTPGVICQGKQVLKPRWVSYGSVQPLDPLLTLLKRCKVASTTHEEHIKQLARSNQWNIIIWSYNFMDYWVEREQIIIVCSDV